MGGTAGACCYAAFHGLVYILSCALQRPRVINGNERNASARGSFEFPANAAVTLISLCLSTTNIELLLQAFVHTESGRTAGLDMHSYQEVPLLGKDPEPGNFRPEIESRQGPKRFWEREPAFAISVAANALLLIFCGLLLFTKTSPVHKSNGLEEPYCKRAGTLSKVNSTYSLSIAPANAVIEYERRPFVNDSEFAGAPGPRWEHAIHTAMEGNDHIGGASDCDHCD